MDIPFILRNYAGLLLARIIEQVPDSLRFLPDSSSRLKPFIAARLRGNRFSQTVTRSIDGFRMRLDLSDNVQRLIYLGVFENEEIAWCRPLVREGGTCIDVGANVGWFALHFATWVGPTGQVVALEADHDVAKKLTENCELSEVTDRVEILNCAVTDKVGTVEFARSFGAGSGWGSLETQGEAHGAIVEVPGVTLDSLIAKKSLLEVDMLKIDVESHEFAVLAGARESLKRRIFRNILIEWEGFGQARSGRTVDEMAALFEAAGYSPSAHTTRLLERFRGGSTDPRRTLANLLYHRVD